MGYLCTFVLPTVHRSIEEVRQSVHAPLFAVVSNDYGDTFKGQAAPVNESAVVAGACARANRRLARRAGGRPVRQAGLLRGDGQRARAAQTGEFAWVVRLRPDALHATCRHRLARHAQSARPSTRAATRATSWVLAAARGGHDGDGGQRAVPRRAAHALLCVRPRHRAHGDCVGHDCAPRPRADEQPGQGLRPPGQARVDYHAVHKAAGVLAGHGQGVMATSAHRRPNATEARTRCSIASRGRRVSGATSANYTHCCPLYFTCIR